MENISQIETSRIIEDEIGKDNLIRIAVKYLYNAIGGANA